MTSLLPPNATQLEQLAAEAIAQLERVPVPMRNLVNPDRCPVHLLPYLAWAFSVDRWDPLWPEPTKRQIIRSAWYVHAHKGTVGALRRVVEPLGATLAITEWWQTEPPGVPGTFVLDVGVPETGLSDELYDLLTWLIDDAKPVSRHLTALSITLQTPGFLYLGGALLDGDTLTIYPPDTEAAA
ncbi:phage tail protein I [Pseudomonas japonica]|uniref:phage tail protein I n=1 Tax=Pseudomonas japonica TaxID=256466 RepID=UPI0015E3D44D|nr:phage tail protein I [Pseudomonas japonica]MBA1289175.1 phage tail protein I [Pseudomonas japonica]